MGSQPVGVGGDRCDRRRPRRRDELGRHRRGLRRWGLRDAGRQGPRRSTRRDLPGHEGGPGSRGDGVPARAGPGGMRRLPRPSRGGRDRPLPAALAGSERGTGRRHLGSDRRTRRCRQGPLGRRLELRSDAHRAVQRHPPRRLVAAGVLAGSSGGPGADPLVRRGRDRRPQLLATRRRPPDRSLRSRGRTADRRLARLRWTHLRRAPRSRVRLGGRDATRGRAAGRQPAATGARVELAAAGRDERDRGQPRRRTHPLERSGRGRWSSTEQRSPSSMP